ncbi:MAG: hypothetical protein ABJG68_07420 [Crocinitomicaceae bacterium]
MNKFTKIFSIQLHHSYFEEGVEYPVQFSWAQESQELIKKYGIRMVSLKNGIEVYCDRKRPLREYFDFIQTVSGETCISVLITATDEKFSLYTNFDLGFLGRYSYLSTNRRKLYSDSYILVDSFKQAGNYLEFARVEISFEDVLSLERPSNYVVSLDARKTKWNYFIINQSQLDLEAPAVVGKSEVFFDGPSKVNLPNGKEALLFSSGSTLLKLSKVPKYQFSLVNDQNGKSKLNGNRLLRKNVFKALPNPDPAKFEIYEEDGTKTVTSPIYVYV